MNVVSISSHKDLSSMIDDYATNLDFRDKMSAFSLGNKEEPYDIKDGFMVIGYVLLISYVQR